MFTYTCLFLLAVYLNRKNPDSVLLTLLVGLSWYIPVDLIHSRGWWFTTCIASEVFVLIFSLILNTASKFAMVGITFMLAMSHAFCWKFKSLETYYIVENYLEYVEILTCILFSNPIIHNIKERVKRCHQWKF